MAQDCEEEVSKTTAPIPALPPSHAPSVKMCTGRRGVPTFKTRGTRDRSVSTQRLQNSHTLDPEAGLDDLVMRISSWQVSRSALPFTKPAEKFRSPCAT